MNQIELNALLEKYLSGNCSPEEIILLESWYLSQSAQAPLPSPSEEELHLYKKAIWTGIQQSQQNQLETAPAPKKLKRLSPALLAAAAVLLLLLSFGGYLLLHQQSPITAPQASVKPDLLPGSNKAILILPNGKQINLSNATLVSYKNGAYPAGEAPQTGYHTIKTPNGGQWPALELPDGTKVFLDAASSITFPVTFAQERKVTLTGQAYFQVVHQTKRPFLITAKGLTIEDLGTDFNVNAYDDEATVKTTLVEGSVSIANKAEKVILVPGQQAIAAAGKDKIITREANIEEVLAWKNGLFQFNRTPIAAVMRQISRWYNVEVVYKNEISNISFTGNLPRNLKASRLLEMLSITGLDFKIDGKKIIVSTL